MFQIFPFNVKRKSETDLQVDGAATSRRCEVYFEQVVMSTRGPEYENLSNLYPMSLSPQISCNTGSLDLVGLLVASLRQNGSASSLVCDHLPPVRGGTICANPPIGRLRPPEDAHGWRRAGEVFDKPCHHPLIYQQIWH